MATVRQVAIKVLRAVLFAASAFGAAGWAAERDADERIPDGQAEPSAPVDGPGLAEQTGSVDEDKCLLQELLANCRSCSETGANEAADLMNMAHIPGCFMRQILDPCGGAGWLGASVGLAIFVVLVAVLMRQAIIGYREWRLSFACFLIVFLAGSFGFWGGFSLGGFVGLVFASAFLAGMLSFWLKYMLDLLAVVVAALVVAGLVQFGDPMAPWHVPLAGAVGLASGVWLHWWRDHRKKKQPAGGGQTPATGSGGATPGGVR